MIEDLLMADLATARMNLAKLCAQRGDSSAAAQHMEQARKILVDGPPISTQCGAQGDIDRLYGAVVKKYNCQARYLHEKNIAVLVLDMDKIHY